MPSILIIDKNSVVKPYNTKTFVEDELYKKAGFKSKEGFAKHSEWNVSIKNAPTTIELYGKISGRAGQENKYDFPPPADNILFFGSCVLVGKSGDNVLSFNGKPSPDNPSSPSFVPHSGLVVVDITVAEWEKIYEQLFGGFEDINASDSGDDEDDESLDDDVPKTKEGYVKDGFILDDTEESDESEYEPVVSSKSKSTKKKAIAKPKSTKTSTTTGKTTKKTKSTEKTEESLELAENIQIKIHPETIVATSTTISPEEEFDPTYFSCTDELVEESYI